MNNKHNLLNEIKHSCKVALLWATGVGKTKMAIDICNKLYNSKDVNNILIVIAERAHKKNWEEELIKWNIDINLNIKIVCYASLKKYKYTDWDMIIFDEAHHLSSELRLDTISNIHALNTLFLSATMNKDLLQSLSYIYGTIKISTISLGTAFTDRILPIPKVVLVPLILSNTDRTTITYNRGNSTYKKNITCRYIERFKYLRDIQNYPNITLTIDCTIQQKYDYLTEQYTYWKSQFLKSRAIFAKNKWLALGLERKIFLGNTKTDIASKLLKILHNKRYICFCASIKQADLLNSNNSIHSNKKDSLSIINDFNTKKINSLLAVNMLQEGQNLVDIEAGVIIQLDGQERTFIQKFGRNLRAKSPIQFILYYKHTRDVDYLDNIIKSINIDYITILKDIPSIETFLKLNK